jgi:hypothetical protein
MLRYTALRGRLTCQTLSSPLFKPTAAISGSSGGGGVITAPSNTTTVLIKKVPYSVTETSLRNALTAVPLRKLELQPGFVVHMTNPAAASQFSKYVNESFQCKVIT